MRSRSTRGKRVNTNIISNLLVSKLKKPTSNSQENLSPALTTVNLLSEDLLPSCSTAFKSDSSQKLILIQQPKISLTLRTSKWESPLMDKDVTISSTMTTTTSMCFRCSNKQFISKNLLRIRRNLINQKSQYYNSSIFSLLVSSVINFSKKFRRKSKNNFSLTAATSTTKNIKSHSCSEKRKGDFQLLRKKYLLHSQKVFKRNILICGKNLLTLTRKKLYFIKWILIVFLLSTFTAATTTSESGSIHQRMNDDEIQIIRSLFLKKFGLNDLEDEINKRNLKGTTKSHQTRLRIPNHIWDLYEQREYDTVKHYFPSVTALHEEIMITEPRMKYFSRKLSFNIPVRDLLHTKEEKLSKVEFRMSTLKMKKNCIFARNSSNNLYSKYSIPSIYTNCGQLHLYEYLSSENSNRKEKRFLSWQPIEYATNWVYFNIPHTKFRTENAQTMEFIIEFSTTSTNDDIDNLFQFDNDHGESLAVFFEKVSHSAFDSNMHVSTNSFRRNKRSAVKLHKKRKHRKHTTPADNNECKRSSLYVDFSELNWQDWIMAPVGYEAYQCRGRCTHPMPSHLNTTNHAIIQSLINSIDHTAAPQPSCVPIEMSAISILYRDINNVIVVKTYPDMKVEACGCH